MIFSLGNRTPVFKGGGHFVAANASIIGSVVLEENVSIWFGAVLRADNDSIEIGRDSNVQDGAILHTDPGIQLRIGNGVTVGHRVMLHGCEIGNNTLIGIGSTILNHAVVGDNCVVGANSLITEGKSFPPGSLIMGAPAKVVRQLNPDEVAKIQEAAKSYVEKCVIYAEQLLAIEQADSTR
jgi:carbonic anhydrase/acetyltransferase-like protein (isoleucine patch superfamily)